MRLKTTNVVFSSRGMIYNPFELIFEQNIPWYEILKLPLIVVEFADKIANFDEGTMILLKHFLANVS